MVQDEGYRDPNTGEIRRVPFEIMVEGDKAPIYEETLEDVRRFNENPQLPFNAFGTLALARAEFDANSGSSQVFFLLKVGPMLESTLTLLTHHSPLAEDRLPSAQCQCPLHRLFCTVISSSCCFVLTCRVAPLVLLQV